MTSHLVVKQKEFLMWTRTNERARNLVSVFRKCVGCVGCGVGCGVWCGQLWLLLLLLLFLLLHQELSVATGLLAGNRCHAPLQSCCLVGPPAGALTRGLFWLLLCVGCPVHQAQANRATDAGQVFAQ